MAEADREPVVIDPRAVYTLESARRLLGLRRSCLPREVKLGRLRVSRRANRVWISGAELWRWLFGTVVGNGDED